MLVFNVVSLAISSLDAIFVGVGKVAVSTTLLTA